MSSCETNVWRMAPTYPETPEDFTPAGNWRRVTDANLVIYIQNAGERGPRGHYRAGFDFRWTIWFHGTLLGEGFTDNHYAARSAAMQEVDRVEYRIREAIRAMDIRNASAIAGGTL
jgi:hypothetical protein